jgi:hypothetical protein
LFCIAAKEKALSLHQNKGLLISAQAKLIGV